MTTNNKKNQSKKSKWRWDANGVRKIKWHQYGETRDFCAKIEGHGFLDLGILDPGVSQFLDDIFD